MTAALDAALSQADVAARGPDAVAAALAKLGALVNELTTACEQDASQANQIRGAAEAVASALEQAGSGAQTMLRDQSAIHEAAQALQKGTEST
ncbi:MAG TPA: hypothetical protein VIW29_14310, partial [Polyangiaceae bacterium]